MKLTVLTLADYVNTAEGGKLNILGIFDKIGAKEFPTRHGPMTIVLRFLCDYADSEEEPTVKIQLEAPSGKKLVDVTVKIRIPTMQPGQPATVNQVLQLVGVEFKQSGTYPIRVYVEDELAGEIPLLLVRA